MSLYWFLCYYVIIFHFVFDFVLFVAIAYPTDTIRNNWDKDFKCCCCHGCCNYDCCSYTKTTLVLIEQKFTAADKV